MSLVTGQRNACLVLMLSPMASLSITVQRSHLMDIFTYMIMPSL